MNFYQADSFSSLFGQLPCSEVKGLLSLFLPIDVSLYMIFLPIIDDFQVHTTTVPFSYFPTLAYFVRLPFSGSEL